MLAVVLAFALSAVSRAQEFDVDPALEAGFRDMYGMNFDGCEARFAEYKRVHATDPLGDAALAACVLFKEFNRVEVLDAEFYTDDKKLFGDRKIAPDPEVKRRLTAATDHAIELASGVLRRNPQSQPALFARAMANGLMADYGALVERRYLASAKLGRIALDDANTLLRVNSTFYDAYIWPGVANYVVGSLAFPLRWLARLRGYPGDKERGIANLQLAADKGHLLKPYAKILLVVTNLRSKNRAAAHALLVDLSTEFPTNPLFAKHARRLNPAVAR
jgi:hypothetical protein